VTHADDDDLGFVRTIKDQIWKRVNNHPPQSAFPGSLTGLRVFSQQTAHLFDAQLNRTRALLGASIDVT